MYVRSLHKWSKKMRTINLMPFFHTSLSVISSSFSSSKINLPLFRPHHSIPHIMHHHPPKREMTMFNVVIIFDSSNIISLLSLLRKQNNRYYVRCSIRRGKSRGPMPQTVCASVFHNHNMVFIPSLMHTPSIIFLIIIICTCSISSMHILTQWFIFFV